MIEPSGHRDTPALVAGSPSADRSRAIRATFAANYSDKPMQVLSVQPYAAAAGRKLAQQVQADVPRPRV